MGLALQVITGQATNPGTTITALTPNTGDSYTVRSTNMNADIELLNAWAFTTTNLLFRVRSPRMHDLAQNMRMQPQASLALPLMNGFATQVLYSQDPMIVELTGGAAEVDAASLLVFYNDLPGIAARLHAWAEIQPLIAELTTVEVDLTSSATSCNYSATVALNGTFDTLIRNKDYAVLGYECGTSGLTLGLTGADTGNLRVGGPLINRSDITGPWFVLLSQLTGKPLIPVINSANVATINVDCVAQATSTAFKVAFHLALLKQTLPGNVM